MTFSALIPASLLTVAVLHYTVSFFERRCASTVHAQPNVYSSVTTHEFYQIQHAAY